jgi:hypothetical protein
LKQLHNYRKDLLWIIWASRLELMELKLAAWSEIFSRIQVGIVLARTQDWVHWTDRSLQVPF